MIPIIIPAGERCYCGQNDWVRTAGQACTAVRVGRPVVACFSCGYVAAVVTEASS